MKIAVIDGGVVSELKDGLNIVEDLMVNSENMVVQRPKEVQVLTDHGVNVCKIINMYASEAEIISIKIFNTLEMKTDIEALVAAFRYCLDKEIPIIHLSGGTVNLFDDYILKNIVKEMINNNQIIVAAHSNNKSLSFPALYPYVFSARAIEFTDFHKDIHSWGFSFFTPSQHKININENINYVTQIANSYAAPVLTANIYNIIKGKSDYKLSTILKELCVVDNVFMCELPIFLENVTIVNLGNEKIIEDLLPFQVKGIYNDMDFESCDGDYIFIPHRDDDINMRKFKEFIIEASVSGHNVRMFYLGDINSEIKTIAGSYSSEFWIIPEEDTYPIFTPNDEFTDCATIYFQGKKESVYYIMTRLNDIFLKDGFNSFAISDYIDAVMYDIYYFKDIENSIRRKQLEYVLDPDVELIYSRVGHTTRTENSILINVIELKNKMKITIEEEDIKEEMDINDDKDIGDIFNKIVNMG